MLAGHHHPVLATGGFHRAETVELQDVARQLEVLLVVLHDQDQLAGALLSHGVDPPALADAISVAGAGWCSGRVTVKVLPTPGWLATPR